MRILYVGDMHVTPDTIAECDKLIKYVIDVADSEEVDRVVFLGDQYHNHSLVNVDVMSFWKEAFRRMSLTIRAWDVWCLVGNHDRPNDAGSTNHAMMIHAGALNLNVVSTSERQSGILYLPFFHSNEEFIEACNKNAKYKTLVCHQSFNGGKYDNGHYASDGVDPEAIPQTTVISGHIHTPQQFGKVWYVGSPRWRTVSDANTKRDIWVVAHDNETGAVLDKKSFSTGLVCSQIVGYNDPEETPLTKEAIEKEVNFAKDRVAIDVFGTESYCKSKVLYWKAVGVRVRSFPTVNRAARVKESDGVSVAFVKYAASFTAPNGTPTTKLVEKFNERVKF